MEKIIVIIIIFPKRSGKINCYITSCFHFFFGKYHDCNFLKKYIIIRIEINEIENVNLAE